MTNPKIGAPGRPAPLSIDAHSVSVPRATPLPGVDACWGPTSVRPTAIQDEAIEPGHRSVTMAPVHLKLMGEELAMIVRVAGSALTPEMIRQALKTSIAAYKIPKFIELTTEPLPRGATEKFDKRSIQQAFAERMS